MYKGVHFSLGDVRSKEMRVFNKGAELRLPSLELRLMSGESTVDPKAWDEAKKLPKIKRELETGRLKEMGKEAPVKTEPKPDKPDGKKK